MKNKIAVFIIDPQNDFCNPDGALFVSGAVEDNKRLASFIKTNQSKISYIGVTIDSHQIMDIAHPRYWKDEDGNHPKPFTVMTEEDVVNNVWTCVKQEVAINYMKSIKSKGKPVHVIWPEHCIIGTWGNLIDSTVNKAILDWAILGNYVHYVPKGTHSDTEHYGAFEAEVPNESIGTQYNKKLEEALNKSDVIYLAGQAKSHCVANTLEQILRNAPEMAKKITVLEDTMSPVGGGPSGPDTTPTFDELSQPIFDEARGLGVRFSTTEEEID